MSRMDTGSSVTAGGGSPVLVYAAGPSVFRRDAHDVAEAFARICRERGAESLYPLDNVLEAGPRLPWRIREANMAMLARCDAVVADATPFRGPGMDGGTAYEMGVAAALGKPVACYTLDTRPYSVRVADFVRVHEEPGGVLRDMDGMQVERFDVPLFENLMMSCAVERIHGSYGEALDAVLAAVRTQGAMAWSRGRRRDGG